MPFGPRRAALSESGYNPAGLQTRFKHAPDACPERDSGAIRGAKFPCKPFHSFSNRRGATVRLPTDGGQQERELAARYHADALACAFTWQRTHALLERIAEGYERNALREDQAAEEKEWR
jgi:hypothetical protein